MNPVHPTTSEDHMSALQQGDELALSRLMDQWQTPLRSFLYRHTLNEAVAEDLAQETFVRVYQHRARFRSGAKFSTWMFQIALNLARDHARARRRHPTESLAHAPEPATTEHPRQQALASETAAAVREAIASLPNDLRDAVLLSEYQGLSHAEIGAILRATPKAVETRLYRARQQLRTALGRFFKAGQET